MYITVLAGTPWAKMVVFLGNSTIFLATPADSRKAWASNAAFPFRFPASRIVTILGAILVVGIVELPYEDATKLKRRNLTKQRAYLLFLLREQSGRQDAT